MEIPPRTTRAYLWLQILGSPILWSLNTVLALLLWGDLIAEKFPVTAEYFGYLNSITELPWQWKLLITLLVNIFLLVEVSFRVVQKRERQRDEYRAKLQLIEQARPRVVLREPNAGVVEQVQIQATGNTTNVVSFLKARFVNQPSGLPFPNAVAHDVRAKLRFLEPTSGGKLLLAIEGRWAHLDEPLIRDWRQYRNDFLKIEFGIEEEHSLDIAFRDDQTGEFYAFNNDNYNYPQMKKPEHLLAGQQFLVRISLLGPWVDETFEFLFSHDSTGTTTLMPLPLS